MISQVFRLLTIATFSIAAIVFLASDIQRKSGMLQVVSAPTREDSARETWEVTWAEPPAVALRTPGEASVPIPAAVAEHRRVKHLI